MFVGFHGKVTATHYKPRCGQTLKEWVGEISVHFKVEVLQADSWRYHSSVLITKVKPRYGVN